MKKLIILHGEAARVSETAQSPFFNQEYLNGYANFTEACGNNNLELFIANPEEYKEKGVRASWQYNGSQWVQTSVVKADLIQDRFSGPEKPQLDELINRIASEIPVTNSIGLERLCRDKFESAKRFDKDFIPSIAIPKGNFEIEKFAGFSNYELHEDLDPNLIVFKPRYGKGGEGIIVHPAQKLSRQFHRDYIAQPFLETSVGIRDLDIPNRHDLRLVVANGEVKHVEVRHIDDDKIEKLDIDIRRIFYPKSEASSVYTLELKDLFIKFYDVAKRIDTALEEYNPRIYSIDVAQGKSGKPFVFELNTRLSLGWQRDSGKEFIESRKKLQDLVANQFAKQIGA